MKLPTHPLSRARNVSVMLCYIARGTIEREARFLRRGALRAEGRERRGVRAVVVAQRFGSWERMGVGTGGG